MAQEREYFDGEEQTCEDTFSSVWDLMTGLASDSGRGGFTLSRAKVKLWSH